MVMKTLEEIAELLDGDVVGDGRIQISGVRPIEDAGEGDISFFYNEKYLPELHRTRASAVIVSRKIQSAPSALIRVDDPYLGFARIMRVFHESRSRQVVGVSPQAWVGQGVEFGRDVNIYPGAFVGDRVRMGDRVDVHPGVYIGPRCRIGHETVIHANVTIYEDTEIGSRVIIHGGAVLGADGFGFANDRGQHVKIVQVGNVVIEDDVEIGANCTVDRAVMGSTRIGAGTKMDNLVQIGHNVQVGKHCLLVSQVGISGSTHIGDQVTLAGQVGVAGHLTIGDRAKVGAQSGVTKDVKADTTVLGSPAETFTTAKKAHSLFIRLPEIKRELAGLAREMDRLRAIIEAAEPGKQAEPP